MIIGGKKRLRAYPKRNINNVIAMFISMNAVNNDFVQLMNARAQQRIRL